MRRRRKRFRIAEPSRKQEQPYSHAPLATAEGTKASDGYKGLGAARAGHSLLQLQREYGNRYVQRVLALSRQGETESSSGVRAQNKSRKSLGQLLNLKEALQSPDKSAKRSHSLVTQTSPLQVSRQGLLTAAEETAAINFSRRYDERSVRIIQIVTGTNVDGNFGRLTAEAVAAFQNANGLVVDGKVGENTLDVMVPNRVAAGRHEHAIQLVVDFHNLDVTSGTLTVHFDPALAVAGATNFESGNLRVIRVGPPAFASNATLRAAIQAQLAVPAPAPAAVGPRPTHLTAAQEAAGVQFNRRRFGDRRSVLVIQGLVGTRLDGLFGPDTVERIAEFQNANGLTVDGKVGQDETLPLMVNQLIAAGSQNAVLRMIVDFFDIRDDGNLLDVRFDATVAANASTDFRPNEPVRVLVGPTGLAQPFAGIVHTIAHEFEHVRRLKEGIGPAATHEFLGEAIEILSEGMPEEALEAVAPGAPGFVAGFADDAGRALANWNAMPLADRQRFRGRFIAVRQRVRDRVAAGTPAQQALHAPLVAGYNAVVLPPP
jgi:peptidoglycan hydrolase-like protein with peptidoglycan-binding domain